MNRIENLLPSLGLFISPCKSEERINVSVYEISTIFFPFPYTLMSCLIHKLSLVDTDSARLNGKQLVASLVPKAQI